MFLYKADNFVFFAIVVKMAKFFVLTSFLMVVFCINYCVSEDTHQNCGRPNMYREKRMIRGGEIVNPSDYPFIVGVIAYKPHYPLYHKCTGALISDNYVLTAGHCYKDTYKTKVAFKTKELKRWASEYTIPGTYFVHPDYSYSKYCNVSLFLSSLD